MFAWIYNATCLVCCFFEEWRAVDKHTSIVESADTSDMINKKNLCRGETKVEEMWWKCFDWFWQMAARCVCFPLSFYIPAMIKMRQFPDEQFLGSVIICQSHLNFCLFVRSPPTFLCSFFLLKNAEGGISFDKSKCNLDYVIIGPLIILSFWMTICQSLLKSLQ